MYNFSSDSITEVIYALKVVGYPIVMIVSSQYLIQLFNYLRKRQYSHFCYLSVHFPALLRKLLSAGFPLHPELSVPAFETIVC